MRWISKDSGKKDLENLPKCNNIISFIEHCKDSPRSSEIVARTKSIFEDLTCSKNS